MELSSFSFQFPRLSCCDQDKDATPQSQKIEYVAKYHTNGQHYELLWKNRRYV